ncbi:MAG: DUF928 domain-containing protein [Cyanobacteria bacterium P01_A01_bin.116]
MTPFLTSIFRFFPLNSGASSLTKTRCQPDVKKWAAGMSPVVLLAAQLMAPMPGYSVEFPDAGDRGAPSRTAGGGTRGGLCEGGDWMAQSIRALVPNNNVSTFVGDRASLWIYVADGFAQKTAEIYVQDPRTRQVVHQKQLSLAALGDGGILQLELPATDAEGAPLLEKEQNYFWEFAIICNPDDRTQDYIVRGFINQMDVSSQLSDALATAAPEEQLALYAKAEIWQETVSLAIAQKASNPQLWKTLLASVGLESLAASPLKDCCDWASQ